MAETVNNIGGSASGGGRNGGEEVARGRAQAVGLFRWQLICPALDSTLSMKARGRLVRSIAAAQHVHPSGLTAGVFAGHVGSVDPPLPGRRVRRPGSHRAGR